MGRLDEALSLSREINKPMLEAQALLVLGDTYSDIGDEARAEPVLKRALAIFERSPSGNRQHAATLASLGAVYVQEGKNTLAEDAIQPRLEHRRARQFT